MAAQLTVLDGNTFFVSDLAGDVVPGGDPDGFFQSDMRHLSRWRLLVNGQPIHVLTSRTIDYSAAIFGTLASVTVGENPPVSIRRDRFIAEGVHEDLTVENHTDRPQSVSVEVEYASDFGDLFEVKDRKPKRGQFHTDISDQQATLHYGREGFSRATVIGFSAPCSVGETSARFELRLGPRERWQTCIDIATVVDGKERRLEHGARTFGNPRPRMPVSFEQWMSDAPRLETDFDVLRHTYRQSLIDLAALRFRPWRISPGPCRRPACPGSWRSSVGTV